MRMDLEEGTGLRVHGEKDMMSAVSAVGVADGRTIVDKQSFSRTLHYETG